MAQDRTLGRFACHAPRDTRSLNTANAVGSFPQLDTGSWVFGEHKTGSRAGDYDSDYSPRAAGSLCAMRVIAACRRPIRVRVYGGQAASTVFDEVRAERWVAKRKRRVAERTGCACLR